MVYVQTILRVTDNTNAQFALCIRILTNSSKAKPGDGLVVVIKSVIYNKKIKFRKKKNLNKGSIKHAVLLRTSFFYKRLSTTLQIKALSNSVALVGKWKRPLANRIIGPIFFEVRATNYLYVAMIAEGVL